MPQRSEIVLGVDQPDALVALRCLQIADQLLPLGAYDRRAILLAEDWCGDQLGLSCSGEREGEGIYSHDGDTCRVHEWIDEADGEALGE